jgi:3-methyladenine DNA glycosylase/8-oxoguanine DNA glycosylase
MPLDPKVYGRTPSQLRRGRKPLQATQEAPFCCTLTLPYRPILDWETMLAFFGNRAIPGVECTQGSVYYRTIRCNATAGVLAVAQAPEEDALTLRLFLNDSRDLSAIVERVRRMFDLDANMTAIHAVLKADPVLAPLVRKHPGLRLPGAWDPFETAVRAVTGQQVSVKAARTVLGRIAAQAGPACANDGHAGLTRFFPMPAEILAAPLEAVGMPGKRVAAIKHLAEAVASGAVDFEAAVAPAEFVHALTRLPGIGEWTAQYIAMRALGEPDAFPADDLGLKRALQQGGPAMSRRQILDRAQAWRPWRAYAAIHLWNS